MPLRHFYPQNFLVDYESCEKRIEIVQEVYHYLFTSHTFSSLLVDDSECIAYYFEGLHLHDSSFVERLNSLVSR